LQNICFLQTAPENYWGGYEKFLHDMTGSMNQQLFSISKVRLNKKTSSLIYRFTGDGDKESKLEPQEMNSNIKIWKSILTARKNIDILYLKNDIIDLIIAKLF
jgi:hypothetical protein